MNQIASTTLTRNRDEDPAWPELHTRRMPFAERVEHTNFGEYGSLYVYNRYTESKAHQAYMNRLKRFLGTGALSTLDVQFGPDRGGPILSAISKTFGGHEFYVFGLESPDPKTGMQYALAISDRVVGTIRGKATRFSNFLDSSRAVK